MPFPYIAAMGYRSAPCKYRYYIATFYPRSTSSTDKTTLSISETTVSAAAHQLLITNY